jgi:hypothetical protein
LELNLLIENDRNSQDVADGRIILKCKLKILFEDLNYITCANRLRRFERPKYHPAPNLKWPPYRVTKMALRGRGYVRARFFVIISVLRVHIVVK